MTRNPFKTLLLGATFAVFAAACTETPNGFEPAFLDESEGLTRAEVAALVEAYSVPVDLTELGSEHLFKDGVVVQQSIFDGSTGTGVFESFVRLNSNNTMVQGYNTSGRPTHFDEMASSNFTRDLNLSAVPLQPLAENGGGGANYYEFRADINQTAGGTLLSLDKIRIVLSKTPGANPTDPFTVDNFGTCAVLAWEMPEDDWIGLNYILAPGSGNGDMRLLIPKSIIDSARETCDGGPGQPSDWYVYLYSMFGNQGDAWGQDNGFEEWSVRRRVEAPEAFKTAEGQFDRAYTWTIDKDVEPSEIDLFVGDDADAEYEVTVDATPVDSNFRVSGVAALFNGGSAIRVTGRMDQIGIVSLADIDGPFVQILASPALNCDESVLTNPGGNTLPAGATLECPYSYSFPGTPPALGEGQTYANRVTFTTGTGNNAVLYSYTEVFFFTNPTNVTNGKITVTDAFDGGDAEEMGTVDAETAKLPYTFTYTRNFECTEEGSTDYPNTAEIEETGQTADASVTVNCYELDVSKDADTSFRWDWEIDKVEDDETTEVTLMIGELHTLNYTVTVTGSAEDHRVTGDITVTNSAPIDAVLNSIADIISKDGEADIPGTAVCLDESEDSITFPYTLEAGETLSCTYSADLPNGDERLNTVTVEQQNFSYDKDGDGTASGTTDYDAEADVEFGIGDDNCVEVYDDKTDPSNPVFLGHACAQADAGNPAGAELIDENGEASFQYSLSVGRNLDADIILECDDTELTNTATVHLLEEETPLDQASWTVDVFVECPPCESETAWAANGNESGVFLYNPDGGGNWATYVQHAEKTVTLFAGQTQLAGTVTFSEVVGGMVTITVQLGSGWTFEAGSVVAVQGYAAPPSGNPAPGQFDDKEPASGSSHTITVPAAAYYGVHAVVESNGCYPDF